MYMKTVKVIDHYKKNMNANSQAIIKISPRYSNTYLPQKVK